MDEGKDRLQKTATLFSVSLAESRDAYNALLDLEKEQQTLIENVDFDGAARKISEKHSLLDTIEKRVADLQIVHEQWQSERDLAPESLRDYLQIQVEALREVISAIIGIQKSNEEKLKEHGEEINRKLRDLQREKNVHRNYRRQVANHAYDRSKFYDTSS